MNNAAASRHRPRADSGQATTGLARQQRPVLTATDNTDQAPSTESTGDLADIDLGHVSNAEARRLIRKRNREYFSKHIWNPALQQEFAGAYRLAHETSQEGRGGTINDRYEKKENEEKSGPVWNGKTPTQTNADDSEGESDWGKSVRHALALLQNRIANEDPRKFLRSRRESALRVWQSAGKRASGTPYTSPLSPTICATPNSPSGSEEIFIARVLRENGKTTARHGLAPRSDRAPFPNLRHAAVLSGLPPMSQIDKIPAEEMQGRTMDGIRADFTQKTEEDRKYESFFVDESEARSLGCLGGLGGHGVRKLLAAEKKR